MGYIIPHNEKTKLELAKYMEKKEEKPLKLVYAKFRNGKMIDAIWRNEEHEKF